jgi:hypothetical protein
VSAPAFSRGVSAWLDASVIAGGDIRDSRTFCPLLRCTRMNQGAYESVSVHKKLWR